MEVAPSSGEVWPSSWDTEESPWSSGPLAQVPWPTEFQTWDQTAAYHESQGHVAGTITALENALAVRLEAVAKDGKDDQILDDIKQIGEKLVSLFNKMGVQCFKKGDFGTAQTFLIKAAHYTSAELELALFPSETSRLNLRAATFNNFGCMERRQGHAQSALKQLRKAQKIEESLGTPSPSTIVNICAVLTELQKFSKAVDEAKKAIRILQPRVDAVHGMSPNAQPPEAAQDIHLLVVSWHNLAMALRRASPVDTSNPCWDAFKTAVGYAHTFLGRDHPTTTTTEKAYLEALTECSNLPKPPKQIFDDRLRPGMWGMTPTYPISPTKSSPNNSPPRHRSQSPVRRESQSWPQDAFTPVPPSGWPKGAPKRSSRSVGRRHLPPVFSSAKVAGDVYTAALPNVHGHAPPYTMEAAPQEPPLFGPGPPPPLRPDLKTPAMFAAQSVATRTAASQALDGLREAAQAQHSTRSGGTEASPLPAEWTNELPTMAPPGPNPWSLGSMATPESMVLQDRMFPTFGASDAAAPAPVPGLSLPAAGMRTPHTSGTGTARLAHEPSMADQLAGSARVLPSDPAPSSQEPGQGMAGAPQGLPVQPNFVDGLSTPVNKQLLLRERQEAKQGKLEESLLRERSAREQGRQASSDLHPERLLKKDKQPLPDAGAKTVEPPLPSSQPTAPDPQPDARPAGVV